MFETSVVLFVFNRPDLAARVFARIRALRPSRLFIISDGPRQDRPEEHDKVEICRNLQNSVDWPCRLEVNFSDVNLGCKRRISSGIDWVFERVNQAIFLEDDCLPDPTFFRFAEELLARYRDDPRVAMISGDNFLFNNLPVQESYYFSRNMHIWGWATWKDRWVGRYDVELNDWPSLREEGWLRTLISNQGEARFWIKCFDAVHSGLIDTWDYQWVYAAWRQGGLCVLPRQPLISNIGFRSDATHTTVESRLASIPTVPMAWPLEHPATVARDSVRDEWTYRNIYRSPISEKISRVLLAALRRVF